MKLPWQISDEEKERQMPYLPPSLQVAPGQLADHETRIETLETRVPAPGAPDQGLYSPDSTTYAPFSLLASWRALLGTAKAAWDEVTGVFSADGVQVNPTVTPPAGSPGRLVWNDTMGTMEFQLKGGNVTLQVGQENVLRVRNSEGTPLVDGEVVYVTGSSGTHNTVLRADYSTEATSSTTIGVVTEPIGAHPGEGFITTFGMVTCNTNHLTEGAQVYLSAAGATTDVKPTAPQHTVGIGWCVKKAGAGAGKIFVHVQNGYELSELHDVLLTALASGDTLYYDGTLWRNRATSSSPWVLKAGDTMTGDLKVVKANARMGIGTASPQAPLDVSWDQNNAYNTVGWFNIPLLSTGNRVLFGVGKSLVADGYGWMGYYYAAAAADRTLEWGHSGTTALVSLAKSGLLKIISNNLVLPKTSGYGIQVDPANPSFGWRDLTYAIDPKATGLGTPTRTLYRGTIYGYAFTVGDLADFDGFHIPHDYLPGSDLYVHVHWSHNGTAISGSAVFEVTMTYAKGHNQANFPAEVTQTITVATPDIATVPQYRHRVDEVQASTPGGSATLHNTSNIEVDGLLIGYIKLVTLPTITGGNLFIHTVDIHYQSTNMATKQKAPNFYT